MISPHRKSVLLAVLFITPLVGAAVMHLYNGIAHESWYPGQYYFALALVLSAGLTAGIPLGKWALGGTLLRRAALTGIMPATALFVLARDLIVPFEGRIGTLLPSLALVVLVGSLFLQLRYREDSELAES